MYKTLIAAATLLLAIGGHAQNTKLVLKKGKKYEVTATTLTDTKMKLMGQDMNYVFELHHTETYEVKNTLPGKTDLVATATRMILKTKDEEGEKVYDSNEKDLPEVVKKQIMKTIGKPRNIGVDASGTLIKEDDEDGAANATMQSVGGGLGNSPALFWTSVIGRQLAVGTSWSDSAIKETDKSKTKTAGLFSVKSIEQNMATVTFNGTSTNITITEPDGNFIKEMNKAKTINTISGEAKIDLTTGIVMESNTASDGTMTMEMGKQVVTSTMSEKRMTKTKAL